MYRRLCVLPRHIIALSFTIVFSFVLSHSQVFIIVNRNWFWCLWFWCRNIFVCVCCSCATCHWGFSSSIGRLSCPVIPRSEILRALEFLTYLNLWELWPLCKKIRYFWSQCQVLPVFVDLVCMALAESGTPSLACGYLRKHKMLWIWMLQANSKLGWTEVLLSTLIFSLYWGFNAPRRFGFLHHTPKIALRLEIGVASIHLPHYCFPKLYKIVKQCAVTGIWS